MIKDINQKCNKFNDILGIKVTLPEPEKNTLNAVSSLNFVVGAGLVAASVVFAQKWCAVAGGLGIISSIVLKHETK